MTTLLLDEAVASGEPRHAARTRIMEALARPLDPKLAEEYDRDNWGRSAEAQAADAANDAFFGEG